MTDATTERARPPAEPDRRFYAFVVDRLMAWSVEAAAAYLAARYLIARDHPLVGVLAVATVVVLVSGTLTVVLGRTGSSPGRAAAGLRLVDARTGQPLGPGRALRRQLLLALATLPTFGLGLAALAWTALTDPGGRRHGWHDRVVGSEVVDDRVLRVEEVAADDPGPGQIVNLTALRLVPAPASAQAPDAVERGARPAAVPRRQSRPDPRDRWELHFDTGETLVVDGPVLLGRDPEARPGEQARHLLPLRSSDLSLSKTHACLRLGGEGVLELVDLGSTNGSILLRRGAARELPAGRATTLLDGDVVRFGDREMRVSRRIGSDPLPDDSITVR
ncbi:FHA domain-containing protein [Nocardioides sp. T2.26MG-1]|uniref:FHA domain-containing protein n=1 Tax=Nocardioides sp. T2.26MG-1 TaxID=3041166 RepID=UPI00247768E3|nr:FHA domain-containing protein [Nocardioides sp. T2.26MG-1]CAI9416885.1 hypothetical protein HIDPHFAB_02884 [Nocardioides sp. T2.26MG-1]